MSLQMKFDFGRMDLRNTILTTNENGLLNGKDKKVKIREFKEMHIAPKGGGRWCYENASPRKCTNFHVHKCHYGSIATRTTTTEMSLK